MNLFVIAYVLGQVCKFEAGFMLLPMVCALCYSEYSIALIFFLCALLCLTVGFFLTLKKPEHMRIRPKEAMAATALSWVVISVLDCLRLKCSGLADPLEKSGVLRALCSIFRVWTFRIKGSTDSQQCENTKKVRKADDFRGR